MCVGGKPLHATADTYIICEALCDQDGLVACEFVWAFKVVFERRVVDRTGLISMKMSNRRFWPSFLEI